MKTIAIIALLVVIIILGWLLYSGFKFVFDLFNIKKK